MADPERPSMEPQVSRVLPELIGESPGIATLRAQIAQLVGRQGSGSRLPPLLILGETGTGKGLLARAIHRASVRAVRPFVDIDCASIPETLLEAELFGFERGAFTDARQAKPGLFQTASGGTVFLDEVGLLPKSLQGKLLKVVEERGVRRLGSTQTEVVDLWILAATNVDLEAATREGRFRDDLYHRLAAVTFMVPPLRDRNGDILLLAEHFLARACGDYQLSTKVLAPEAQAAMLAYAWPGNVRELANMMERVVLLSGEDSVISSGLLGLPPAQTAVSSRVVEAETPHLRSLVERFERAKLVEALQAARGNITLAAARLGLPRNTLRYRMLKLEIGPEELGGPPARPAKPPAKMNGKSVEVVPATMSAASTERRETRSVSLFRAVVGTLDGPLSQIEGVLEAIAAKVRSFDGYVEAINGSGLVAIFGLRPGEEAASRAAFAALAILKAGAHALAKGANPVGVKIAIHSCEVSVTHANRSLLIEEEYRPEAERVLKALLGSAEAGSVLVSGPTAHLLRRRFELKRAPGAAGALEPAYCLVGHHRPGFEFSRPALTPFVGRELKLNLLEDVFERAEAGRGQVVGIVGEPGVGKSRLLDEFRQRLAGRQFAYRATRCLPYGRGTADFTVLEVLRQAWGIAGDDESVAIAAKVRQGLKGLGMAADRWAPYLLTLFGIKVEGKDVTGLSPGDRKARIFDALRRVAIERSNREPLIIAVEDLHWIGKTSEAFLTYLVENLSCARILLLTTYRPEYRPPWLGKSYVTQLSLPPLSRAESLAVLHSLLPDDRAAARFSEAILERAEGNPFFLEELARSAAETGDAEVDIRLPETVRASVATRIDRLGDESRRLLQIASVLGRRVPEPLLNRLCGERASLADRVAECKRLELLDEELAEGEPVYVFKQALVREVAYQSLSVKDRQTLHAAAARALESLHRGRPEELRELLAHHYARSS